MEANRPTSSKLKVKAKKVERKIKSREESTSSSKTKDEEHKIYEITSFLRILSNKISRMETQPRVNKNVTNRSLVQYTRPFQPPTLQILNNNQKIQPPLMIDDQDPEEVVLKIHNLKILLS